MSTIADGPRPAPRPQGELGADRGESDMGMSGARYTALQRLIGMPQAEFAATVWSREAHLTRAGDLPRDFADLFSAGAVDQLVANRGLRTPFARMARDGVTLADRRFTLGGGVGAGVGDQLSDDRVLREFTSGATLVLQGLHRTWQPIADFAAQLSEDLGHPVQVNAYVTPPQNQGFSDHYDVHDVFVVQIAGEKRWRIRPPVVVQPQRDQAWNARRAEVEAAVQQPALLEATLMPGDSLYLPRGFLHSASALGGVSIHLTIGVHPWTRRHLIDATLELASRALTDRIEARRSLDLGVDLTSPLELDQDREVIRDLIIEEVQKVDAADLVEMLRAQVRTASRAEPIGVLAQQEHAADEASRWRPRRNLAGHWDVGADVSTFVSRVGRLQVSEAERDTVAQVLGGIRDAGELDPELRRRLALAGLIVPAD